MVDLPCFTPPPTKGYRIATAQRHTTLNGARLKDDGNGCEKTKTHCQSDNRRHLCFSGRCLHAARRWESGMGDQDPPYGGVGGGGGGKIMLSHHT